MMLRGIALISGVIFLAITIAAVIIIYQTGIPFVQRIQSSVVIDQIEGAFTQLNRIIKTIGSEGKGSQRAISMSIESGEISINSEKEEISWDFETDSPIISPRTMQQLDNLKVGSNLKTSTYEGQYAGEDAYVMENQHLQVFIKKIGSSGSQQPYVTEELLLGMHNKDLNQDFPMERLEIFINEGNSTGTGFTKPVQTGDNLPYGEIIAFLDPDDSAINFNISFILESDADFLSIRGSL